MPRLSTIVTNAGRKFFRFGSMFDGPVVNLGVEDNHGQDGPSTVEVSF
jgi:hypothetical protein